MRRGEGEEGRGKREGKMDRTRGFTLLPSPFSLPINPLLPSLFSLLSLSR
jgi:hypothetical protein